MLKLILNFCLFLFFFSIVQSQEKIDISITSPQEEAERLTKLQKKFYKLGDYETFKIYTDSILTLANTHDLKALKIDAIIRLGIYYKKIDVSDKSLTYYLQALELSKKIPENYKKQTVILINLGNLHNLIGNHDKAKHVFNEALIYIDTYSGPDEYRMAAYIGLSEVFSANKTFITSLNYLKKAKVIAEKLKRDDMRIAVYNAIGINHLQLKAYKQALAYSKKAETLFTNEQSAKLRASSHYIMGASLVRLKRYDEAILPLQLAQGLSFTGRYLKIKMDTHKQLAIAFEKQGYLEKANMQQKGYINTQEKYLLSLSSVKRLQVENDLAETEALLKKENRFKWLFILLGAIITVILLSILLIYIKKKKEAQLEAFQLKENQTLLEDENEALKIKIYKLVQRKKEISTKTNNIRLGAKKTSLSQQEQDKYVKLILEYMEQHQPYLDHEVKQSSLAEKLDMSVHLFSEVLNACFQKNFNNFINLYRVDRAKQLMKNPKYDNYKVLAIGYESGFSSKTSFNRVFKQLVEQTPSEYRQQQIVKTVF